MASKADREYIHDHEPVSEEELSRAVRGSEFFAAHGRKSPNPVGRPKAAITKEQLTVRLDPDIVAALKATGKGWQTRMNTLLRERLGL